MWAPRARGLNPPGLVTAIFRTKPAPDLPYERAHLLSLPMPAVERAVRGATEELLTGDGAERIQDERRVVELPGQLLELGTTGGGAGASPWERRIECASDRDRQRMATLKGRGLLGTCAHLRNAIGVTVEHELLDELPAPEERTHREPGERQPTDEQWHGEVRLKVRRGDGETKRERGNTRVAPRLVTQLAESRGRAVDSCRVHSSSTMRLHRSGRIGEADGMRRCFPACRLTLRMARQPQGDRR